MFPSNLQLFICASKDIPANIPLNIVGEATKFVLSKFIFFISAFCVEVPIIELNKLLI